MPQLTTTTICLQLLTRILTYLILFYNLTTTRVSMLLINTLDTIYIYHLKSYAWAALRLEKATIIRIYSSLPGILPKLIGSLRTPWWQID